MIKIQIIIEEYSNTKKLNNLNKMSKILRKQILTKGKRKYELICNKYKD